ncbi:hypothetical protein QQS21_003908 [Conoideocrella luteorostrata]|uniref:Oxidase ustYa n=1 Tax=Conoideocrella luteorostrata TaxID=1105319 RepID=A0AAJ0CSB7_9HYPO|nr:hypothetical protein QQS21_003908 [Conoideocrella luteorostrata]
MDGYRDDRSSTANDPDTESSSLEKEGLLGETQSHISKPRTMRESRCYPLLAAILAIANVLLGALLFVQFQSSHHKAAASQTASHRHHPHGHSAERPTPIPMGGLPHVDSHPDWLPPEEWRTEVFRLHQIYGEEPVGTAKEAWESMIPKGKGFIVVKNDTQLANMPGLRHPEHEQHACVAIFHQMHCLYITYAAYWNARNGNFDEIPPEHLIHCWDYLRQSIMCAGDTSLEWVHPLDSPPNQTSGWGFQHTCKNFDAIFEWTESHRYTEKIEID